MSILVFTLAMTMKKLRMFIPFYRRAGVNLTRFTARRFCKLLEKVTIGHPSKHTFNVKPAPGTSEITKSPEQPSSMSGVHRSNCSVELWQGVHYIGPIEMRNTALWVRSSRGAALVNP